VVVESLRPAELRGNFMEPMKLLKEAYLMLVEDNPMHAMWIIALKDVENLHGYAPKKQLESEDQTTKKNEASGVYGTAERALEVIYRNVGGGGAPPDIILADIELGEGRMNGLEFVREVYDRERAAGRRPIILMLYSSNPKPYADDVETLSKEGIVTGMWNKREFTPKKMIETINSELERRGTR
jgi:CheY-like chemotaxis protein